MGGSNLGMWGVNGGFNFGCKLSSMLNFQFKLQFTAPSYSLKFFCKMLVFLGIEFYWICVTQAKNLIRYKNFVYKQSLHGWKMMQRNWDFQWYNSGHVDMTGISFLFPPYSPWVPSKSVYNYLFRYGLAYLGGTVNYVRAYKVSQWTKGPN